WVRCCKFQSNIFIQHSVNKRVETKGFRTDCFNSHRTIRPVHKFELYRYRLTGCGIVSSCGGTAIQTETVLYQLVDLSELAILPHVGLQRLDFLSDVQQSGN